MQFDANMVGLEATGVVFSKIDCSLIVNVSWIYKIRWLLHYEFKHWGNLISFFSRRWMNNVLNFLSWSSGQRLFFWMPTYWSLKGKQNTTLRDFWFLEQPLKSAWQNSTRAAFSLETPSNVVPVKDVPLIYPNTRLTIVYSNWVGCSMNCESLPFLNDKCGRVQTITYMRLPIACSLVTLSNAFSSETAVRGFYSIAVLTGLKSSNPKHFRMHFT